MFFEMNTNTNQVIITDKKSSGVITSQNKLNEQTVRYAPFVSQFMIVKYHLRSNKNQLYDSI